MIYLCRKLPSLSNFDSCDTYPFPIHACLSLIVQPPFTSFAVVRYSQNGLHPATSVARHHGIKTRFGDFKVCQKSKAKGDGLIDLGDNTVPAFVAVDQSTARNPKAAYNIYAWSGRPRPPGATTWQSMFRATPGLIKRIANLS